MEKDIDSYRLIIYNIGYSYGSWRSLHNGSGQPQSRNLWIDLSISVYGIQHILERAGG